MDQIFASVQRVFSAVATTSHQSPKLWLVPESSFQFFGSVQAQRFVLYRQYFPPPMTPFLYHGPGEVESADQGLVGIPCRERQLLDFVELCIFLGKWLLTMLGRLRMGCSGG